MPHNTAIRLDGPLRGVSLTAPPIRPLLPPPPEPPPPVVEVRTPDPQERLAVERVLSSLSSAVADLRKQQQEWLGEVRHTVVKLALAVASHLVHERIAVGDFAVEALVEKVVRRLDPRQSTTVYLHPEDLELLERRLGDQPLAAGDLRLAPDPRLARQGRRAESGDVGVLWQIEDQLAELGPRLLQCLDQDVTREPVLLRASG